ncbi:uncharacterized protein FIBRA_07419 [Fibroporia radiculosa]|uniref:Fungal N-terminal domain-containing protein n=1 Tax=Fibroporia radiculosa TaxID=599839 RepID=J4H4L7_9APHY|nr:uncharacterized protein FIBRA_07419 [Fibroporia radiculosa]CCM05209.1 predicted protein [Fibroporia radiculosa]
MSQLRKILSSLKHTDVLLPAAIDLLDALDDVATLTSAALFLHPALSSVLSILRTMEQVKDDKCRGEALQNKIDELCNHIDKVRASPDAGTSEDPLNEGLDVLVTAMQTITREIKEKVMNRGRFWRFFRHRSVSGMLDRSIQRLENALQMFNVIALIALNEKLVQLLQRADELARLVSHLSPVLNAQHKTQDRLRMQVHEWVKNRPRRKRGLGSLQDQQTRRQGEMLTGPPL